MNKSDWIQERYDARLPDDPEEETERDPEPPETDEPDEYDLKFAERCAESRIHSIGDR